MQACYKRQTKTDSFGSEIEKRGALSQLSRSDVFASQVSTASKASWLLSGRIQVHSGRIESHDRKVEWRDERVDACSTISQLTDGSKWRARSSLTVEALCVA